MVKCLVHTKLAVDSQNDSNSTKKNYLLLKIDSIKKFLLFRMKYIIDGGCLFND